MDKLNEAKLYIYITYPVLQLGCYIYQFAKCYYWA